MLKRILICMLMKGLIVQHTQGYMSFLSVDSVISSFWERCMELAGTEMPTISFSLLLLACWRAAGGLHSPFWIATFMISQDEYCVQWIEDAFSKLEFPFPSMAPQKRDRAIRKRGNSEGSYNCAEQPRSISIRLSNRRSRRPGTNNTQGRNHWTLALAVTLQLKVEVDEMLLVEHKICYIYIVLPFQAQHISQTPPYPDHLLVSVDTRYFSMTSFVAKSRIIRPL